MSVMSRSDEGYPFLQERWEGVKIEHRSVGEGVASNERDL